MPMFVMIYYMIYCNSLNSYICLLNKSLFISLRSEEPLSILMLRILSLYNRLIVAINQNIFPVDLYNLLILDLNLKNQPMLIRI
jgi:hypothetical protein